MPPARWRSRVPVRLLLVLPLAACQAPAPRLEVTTWGTMREVLRNGHDEGRVALGALAAPGRIGVGALEGLRGEVTVLDGRVLVATAEPASPPGAAPAACTLREAGADEQAALLVLARVDAWEAHPIGTCRSYTELEDAIAECLTARGQDPTAPVPVRVRARAAELELHVLAGACPIAHPEGPPPWRWQGRCEDVELVGFFVEGSGGRLTHHGQRSHLHVVADAVGGHLDEVALPDAVLLLPR